MQGSLLEHLLSPKSYSFGVLITLPLSCSHRKIFDVWPFYNIMHERVNFLPGSTTFLYIIFLQNSHPFFNVVRYFISREQQRPSIHFFNRTGFFRRISFSHLFFHASCSRCSHAFFQGFFGTFNF